MADYKPSDFSLGVFEIFGILLPGAALIFFIGDYLTPLFGQLLFPLGSASQGWIAFLVAAYVAGQLLRGLGTLLDQLYKVCSWLIRKKKDNKSLYCKTKDKVSSWYRIDRDGVNLFYWAGSVVRANNPAASQELDRGGAEAKFFRSSVYVFIAAAVVLWHRPIEAYISVVLAFASLCEFIYLRWMNERLTYEYFLILHCT